MDSPSGSPRLWRPGCTTYPVSAGDSFAAKEQLNQIYERMPESVYDLSLKDLVDPSCSISGEFEAGNCKASLCDSGKSPGRHNSDKLSWSNKTRKKAVPLQKLFVNILLHPRQATKRFSSKKTSSSLHMSPGSPFLPSPQSANISSCSTLSRKSCFPVLGMTSKKRGLVDYHHQQEQQVLPSSKAQQQSSCFSSTLFFRRRCLIYGANAQVS